MLVTMPNNWQSSRCECSDGMRVLCSVCGCDGAGPTRPDRHLWILAAVAFSKRNGSENPKVSIWPCWASTVATADAAENSHPVTTLAPARLPIVRHRDQHRGPCWISLAGEGA